jgi:hypothetical protein
MPAQTWAFVLEKLFNLAIKHSENGVIKLSNSVLPDFTFKETDDMYAFEVKGVGGYDPIY